MLRLLLLFTLVPLAELWLLVKLSGLFGFWTTLAVVLGTGVVGAALARWQGVQALMRLQEELKHGAMPTRSLADGALILVAGVLLITPGVMSDCLGIALLLPPVRSLVIKAIRHWVTTHVQVQTQFWQQTGDNTVSGGPTVIDARMIDARIVDEND
jgi:UPF0716 protein FxsA